MILMAIPILLAHHLQSAPHLINKTFQNMTTMTLLIRSVSVINPSPKVNFTDYFPVLYHQFILWVKVLWVVWDLPAFRFCVRFDVYTYSGFKTAKFCQFRSLNIHFINTSSYIFVFSWFRHRSTNQTSVYQTEGEVCTSTPDASSDSEIRRRYPHPRLPSQTPSLSDAVLIIIESIAFVNNCILLKYTLVSIFHIFFYIWRTIQNSRTTFILLF